MKTGCAQLHVSYLGRVRIPDPEAVKPDDWDEDAPAKIEDPDAVKPEGWMDDGPEYIPDPDATMPEDWYSSSSSSSSSSSFRMPMHIFLVQG